MSNKDPAGKLNPAAGGFNPSANHTNGQVSPPSHTRAMEEDVQGLKHSQSALWNEVENLKAVCNSLRSEIETMQKGGWSVEVGPLQDQEKARKVKAEDPSHRLNQLKLETLKDQKKDDSKSTISNASVPPHLRGKVGQNSGSIPLQIKKEQSWNGPVTSERRIMMPKSVLGSTASKDANNPLVTDGNVDQHTPPDSPALTFQPDDAKPSIEDAFHVTSSAGWRPLFIQQLPPLHPTAVDMIPPIANMVAFSADFLRNTFGGCIWSPGLNYIESKDNSPCILPNRTYYTLDCRYEPYLPKQAGEHGAKLTPFFNENPEDAFDDENSGTSFESVPMFVMTPGTLARNRYVYFGNYSQTRWSDKLDRERMVEHVPNAVKQYWAEELSAVGRPEWITEEMKKHFWPKPVYEGRLFGSQADASIDAKEEAATEKKVERDVKAYVKELKAWEKHSDLKVKLIKKDFVLDAFDAADADEPRGLRLWWEYLQCVDWSRDLYETLVALQSRSGAYN
ncbi:hypothetical protein K504DRAFT_473380 [Pleomassaria siparia CBS 279.74]|uniref:DUF6697 domain-containing protein n=1 Tax=Pleomassaria siparia CBS 279.74 TaxID=1314801 RepID=A0A6G1KN73_9PLEO|nr:hypothetical protein K504DRAFT_473380 [Pleomassaria siparia CBS 279.74]